MNENIQEKLAEIEVSNPKIEQRILELRNIINMKIDYGEQIAKIKSLITFS